MAYDINSIESLSFREGVGELSTSGVRYGDEVFDINGLFDLTTDVFGHDSDF